MASPALSRAFNVRPGEGAPTLLLLAYSLANGLFVAFFFSFAYATFLDQFEAQLLPYAYIFSGVLGYLVLALFSRLEERLPLSRLLPRTLAVLLAVTVAFRLALAGSDSPWLSFLIFLAVDPMLTLLDLTFWGLAASLFNLGQGKRLFGLVSSGGTASEIVGFFAVPLLLGIIGASANLLIIAVVGLGLALAVAAVILRRFADRLGRREAGAAAGARRAKVWASGHRRYLVVVSLLAAAVVFVLYFVDYTFLSQTSDRFAGEKALAGFMGWFWGGTKVVELIAKAASGRVVSHFGLLAGLLSLPVAVLVCVLLAVGTGTLGGTTAVTFFVLVALAKLIEFVCRRSIFDPSFKVLFQPLPEAQRFSVQARVEGGVKQAALSLAGGSLLLIAAVPALGPLHVLWGTAILIGGWLALTLPTYREYRRKLMQALSSLSRKAILPSAEEVLRRELNASEPQAVEYALNVLDNVNQHLLERFAQELLARPEAAVRLRVLERVAASRLVAARPAVERLADADPDPEVRRAAAAALAALAAVDGAAFSADRLALLAASADAEERLLAATVLACGRGSAPRETLGDLLWDADPAVHRLALTAAGQTGDPQHWPRLIQQLSSGLYCKEAATALVAIGEPALPSLENAFDRFDQQPETRLRILRIYERIGGPRAEQLLFALIDYPSRDIQNQALFSLSVLGYQAREAEVGVVTQQLELVVDRFAWYTAAALDIGAGPEVSHLAVALERERDKDLETVFLLLALVADTQALEVMRDSLAAVGEEARAYAAEVAEVVVPAGLKRMLLPLFEGRSPADVLERLDLEFPQQRLERVARIKEIVRQGGTRINNWTRACALRALAEVAPDQTPDETVANLFHSDPMVREMAAWAVYRSDPASYGAHLPRLGDSSAVLSLDAAIRRRAAEEEGERALLLFDKVLVLQQAPIFAPIPAPLLARLAPEAPEVRLQAAEVLFSAGEPGTSLYVVVDGLMEVRADGRFLGHIGAEELIGEMAAVETGVRTAAAIAARPTRLLKIDRTPLYNLMADRMDVIPKIIRVIVERRAENPVTDTGVHRAVSLGSLPSDPG